MELTAKSEVYSAKLSSKIWGHRFMSGQRGPEYVLEFLNVISGTDYRLNESKYKRNKSILLRKFIFEGTKEGAQRALVSIDPSKKDKLYHKLSNGESVEVGKDRADIIREFLRNLEVPIVNQNGKLADRSWFAKTLYPLHESLLFFELRVKGNTIGIERNFFARGGELYYLMISYGTEAYPERKRFIEEKFKELLTRNTSICKIVKTIQTALDEPHSSHSKDFGYLKEDETMRNREELPSLPTNNHPLFERFAIELERLLKLDVDVYEMFKLLTSLICFQLLRYMYERAICLKSSSPYMFFDCLDGQNSQIQKLSSKTFQDNDAMIKEKFEEYFREEFEKQIQGEEYVNANLQTWKDDNVKFFKHMDLTTLKGNTKASIVRTLKKCKTYSDVTTKLFVAVKDVISDQLKKHQLSIVRVLARDGGIGNYKSGSKYRYVLSDDFLKNLVFINVNPNEAVEFSEFLTILFKQYGIIIGENQAKASGLYEKSRLNISYFRKNENALREKLKSNGLLIEYSDATAMIRNPYETKEGVSVK